MVRTRSTRPQAAPHRGLDARPSGTWRRAALVGTAAALGLTLVACAAPSTPAGSSSASTGPSGSVGVQASAAWTAKAQELAKNWTPDTSAPDVTSAALASSREVAALSSSVAGWDSPCAATGVVETLLSASQASLEKGHLRAARGILEVADAQLRTRQKQGLVTAAHDAWFHDQVTRLLAGIPSRGRVTSKAGFPEVSRVLRCSGQLTSSAPKVAAPSLMLAASTGDYSFTMPSMMDAVHVMMSSGFELAALGPEAEGAEVASIVVIGLIDLFWPQSEPNYVTWDAMTSYVDSQIKNTKLQIEQIIDANQLATMHDYLTSLSVAMDRYQQDMSTLVKSPTSFGGYTDASRLRANSDWLTLDNDFTNLLPHFTNDPKSYLNLPETINLYSLYLVSLRSWVLSADTFSENADVAATFKAQREAELTKAITDATGIVTAQLPELEAEYPTTSKSPMAVGWNKHWGFMDVMYQAGYNQVYLWKYMDPIAYPPDAKTGKATIPADTTVVASPCLGGYSVPDGNGGFVAADPTSFLEPLRTSATAGPGGVVPLRNLNVTGDRFQVTGVQEYWGTNVKQTTGTPMPFALHHIVGFNTTPWTWALSATVLYDRESASAPGIASYGGFDELQLSTTTDLTSTTPAMTTSPWMVGSNGLGVDDEMVYSFPGYTLAWVAMAGQRRTAQSATGAYDTDGGGNDECMAVGFRLIDTYNTSDPYPSGT